MARFFSLLTKVRWQVAVAMTTRVARELQTAHGRLDPDERRRLAELIRSSGGRPLRLTPKQRMEVALLARKASGLGA